MTEERLTWVKCIKDDVLVPCIKVCFNGGIFASRHKVPSCTRTLTSSLFSAPCPGSHIGKMESRLSL